MYSMKCTVTNTDMAHPSRALCTTQIYKTLIMTGHFGPRESKQGTRLSDINMAETKSLRNVCSHGYLGYKGAQILDPVCTVNACSDSSTEEELPCSTEPGLPCCRSPSRGEEAYQVRG